MPLVAPSSPSPASTYDPVAEFLSRVSNIKKTSNGWDCRCPAHDDKHSSLSVAAGRSGLVLHCHAGCNTLAILRKVGMKFEDLFYERRTREARRGKIVATYDYVDANGELQYQVVRMSPKSFLQRRPDGSGGWIWDMNGVQRILYRLPELSKAGTVYVCEGEKDVDALRKLGFIATTSPGGAGKWSKTDSSPLMGRDIVVIADKDSSGRSHAADVVASVGGVVVEVPDPHKDAFDWISAGATAEDFRRLSPVQVESSGKTGELGTRDDDGRMILSSKRTLPTARAYIEQFHSHPEHRTLVSYAGGLWRWTKNRYNATDDDYFRSSLHPWLHDAVRYDHNMDLKPFDANPATVDSALKSIKALAYIPCDTVSPSWLTPPETVPAGEIMCCKTCNVHIPSGRIIASTPRLFSTTSLDFDYCPTAPEPDEWIRFLYSLWADDEEQIQLLQEWFGYCLTPDTSQHKMLLVVGPKRSGKGTIGRVLGRLIGMANIAGPSTQTLSGPFGMETLLGKSLAIVADARFAGDGISTVCERLLTISGEDTVTVERKHQTSVTLKLPIKFAFFSNEIPRIADASGALVARFMILRMTESFYGREDRGLLARLTAELPGILNWSMEGWKRLQSRGHFIQPQSIENALSDMEDLSSPVAAFVRDCCRLSPGGTAVIDELYRAWKSWCESDGRANVTTKQVFCRDLLAAFPQLSCKRNHQYGRSYLGIKLTEFNT